MKLVLKSDVEHLGRMGDTVDVADGYARNFLLPRGKGVAATPKNLKALEHQKRLIALQIKAERQAAEGLAGRVSAAMVSIPVQVGEQDKLFGSVTARDIADALAEQGIAIDRRHILLDKPIKDLGSVMVQVKVHHDVVAQMKVDVIRAVPKEEQTEAKKEERAPDAEPAASL